VKQLSEKTVKIYDIQGKETGQITLPRIFSVDIRPDIIRKVVVALQSHSLQPKGRDPMAGKRTTAASFGVGRALSRVPRVGGERHPRAGTAAFAPNVVKGRITHPPSVGKTLGKRINRKERLAALYSAIAATGSKDLVERRGHVVDEVQGFPLVVSDQVQDISRTNEVRNLLTKLGVRKDLERARNREKSRSGKSRMRGRAKRFGVGPLLVVGEDKGVGKAARNLVGVDVVEAKNLNVRLLAPGTDPGRLTVWSESALKVIDQSYSRG
jgi:large subunit ribosomal protein L4e